MPRIFDNIDRDLRPALAKILKLSHRADFCVGYFNLRGWSSIDQNIEDWPGGEGHCCRLLVGMQNLPHEELRRARSLASEEAQLDNQSALRLKNRLAEEFREQLTFGAPSNQDEAGLRRLSKQLKADKLIVRLFLAHPLHAKLYLLHRSDPVNPIVGYLGSSNLTQAGLSRQGELNVDVMDHDACSKLVNWFEERWNEKWCIDISKELAAIIDESWAREKPVDPYHIYVNIAYHLSQEARAGLTEFRIPSDFGNTLLEFQTAAVKIAAHHLNKRGGVLIGDVVGLGKTLMATAVARIFEDDHGLETLIICPKNLVPMWENYRDQYRLRARVLSISRAIRELPDMRRYRLLVIDESHNLRNREGRTYRAIHEYIRENDSKCILLSATPYNKTYADLSSQLRLFVPETEDLGIRPERLLAEIGETEFIRRHQAPLRSLAAFEQSEYTDDWRELMRLYLVRRTRSFIQQNYAQTDPDSGRTYLTFDDGSRSYFPVRLPKTAPFDIDQQYARLFADDVVDAINALELPRYGLGNYVAGLARRPANTGRIPNPGGPVARGQAPDGLLPHQSAQTHGEQRPCLSALAREAHPAQLSSSSTPSRTESRSRSARPDAEMLDTTILRQRRRRRLSVIYFDPGRRWPSRATTPPPLRTPEDFRRRAAQVYENFTTYATVAAFVGSAPHLFVDPLRDDLLSDAAALRAILVRFGVWDPGQDAKLAALRQYPHRYAPRR